MATAEVKQRLLRWGGSRQQVGCEAMLNALPVIAVVTRETRLAGLKARYTTKAAAAFRMKQAVGHEVARRRARVGAAAGSAVQTVALAEVAKLADESEYESEDEIYQRRIKELIAALDFGYPVKQVD